MHKHFRFLFILLALAGCSTGHIRNAAFLEGRGIISDSAMVVSAHPKASEAGALILRRGGNAVDAAVATEFALAVCYPEAGNIGGGGFMLVRTKTGKTDLIDYREKAPKKAFREMFLDKDGNVVKGLSTNSHLASGVPGTVDGMITVLAKYGKLPLRVVIQPAIDLAEKGFRLTAKQADVLNSVKEVLLARNALRPALVSDSVWKEGDLLVQKDLAGTLKRIRDNGREGFYGGVTANLLTDEMKRGKGIISESDLSDYHSVFREPLTDNYKGYKIITVPPPSSGGIILIQLLEMTEPFPIRNWGIHDYRTIHLIAEAERRSFADRAEYMGDPDWMKIPVSSLTDSAYAAKRMSSFNESRASLSADIYPGNPLALESKETTHYTVVDSEGNAVSATTTLNGGFGSGIVVQGAGFLLNNQMDDFSVKPGVPNMYGLPGGEANAIQPGKKMLSSMTPTIIEKGGKLFLTVGSPGGSTIPTTVFQVILNVIDFGLDIQEAIDAARFHHQWLPDRISYEKAAIDSSSALKLEEMGHTLNQVSSLGRVNAIMVLPDGRKEGGADVRGYNSACGY